MKVLVVDDSRAIRRVIGDIMKQLGFEVIEASHGAEALERLAKSDMPDLVMVDDNMPVMNGQEFIKAVRANPAYSGLPLLMVTTETEVERMELSTVADLVNEFVLKPFDKATINDKLQILGIGVRNEPLFLA